MIQKIPLSKLKTSERNPRIISKESFEKLCDNIQKDPEFLNCRPILVYPKDDEYIVYAGNQRFQALKRLKWKEAPCLVAGEIDMDKIKSRAILDNVSAGEFDYDLLVADYELEELVKLGLDDHDLNDAYNLVQEIDSQEERETLEPGKDEDAITKLGDLYELNGHRLVCGDSTLPEYVNKCLNGQEPILMVTDPPYGVEYDASWRRNYKGRNTADAIGKVQNDGQINWALAWHLFPGSVAYIWHAGKFAAEVEKSITDCEYDIISQIIWVKQNFALSRGDYHWQHEPCWYAVKNGHSHNWQGARDQATTWEISNQSAFGSNDEDERTAHSTQKPLECMARPIRNNTSKGEGVYDPFIGSGTTLIAAESLDRICYGIELSPAYCDIIVNRWKRYMEKNNKPYAIKRNGENFDG